MAMPALIFVLAPGFADDPDKFDLAVLLTRICFPYLIFVSLMALFSGVLNAAGRFVAAAFAPTLLNVIFILVLLAIAAQDIGGTRAAGIWLSWGVFAGGIVQLAMVVWAARRANLLLFPRLPQWTPGVKRLFALMGPGIIAGGITQINIVVGTMIASFMPGAVTYLYLADRVYQLPLGIVGIAIGVVLLPDIARRLKAGDTTGVQHQQNRAAEFAMALTLPAAMALIIVPQEIVSGLFEGGAFTAEDAQQTGRALMAFGFGLPAFVLIKVLQPAYFARENTLTPMYYAGVSVAVNVALSLALFPFFQHVGIAIATSVAGWVNVVLLAISLRRRGELHLDTRLRNRIGKMALACLAMGLVLGVVAFGFGMNAPDPGETGRFLHNVFTLAVLVTSGIVTYGAVAYLTGALTRDDLATALRRKGTEQPDPLQEAD